MGNTIARATGHIPSVANGKDAEWYEIVPDTFAVSLDAAGNWVDGTNTAVIDGEECARVFCTYIKHTGSERTSPEEDLVLTYGDRLANISRYTGFAYIRKSDTSANLSLCKINKNNPPTYAGDLLARITITVNRAGENGVSTKIEFSVDGSSWHGVYKDGDVYMRVWNGTAWSSAIKFVGSNGTSFTPRGVASGHFDKASNISTSFVFWTMLVDVNNKYPPLSSSPSIITKSSDGYAATKASIGDGYVIEGHVWVCSTDSWVDFGNIKGADGESVYVTENSVTYGISNDPKNPSSVKTWTSGIPSITAEQPYLWIKNYLRFSDDTETVSYSVTTRGNRGALFRQHVGFVSEDYSYQSGSGTEEFIDAIKVGKVWYRCIKSYNSKDVPTANDVTNTKYWSTSGVTNMDFVATQLLLAEDATINMLGANEINLYNGENMFGSYRVPHGMEGVDGDVDEGKYAFWLGNKQGRYAPFCVTSQGALRSTSGSIGGFTIGQNNLHAENGEMTFDIYHDRLVFVDNNNYRTVMVANSEDDGLTVSLSERDENRMCKLSVGTDVFGNKANVGLYSSSTGYKGAYTQKSFSVGDFFENDVFECVVYEPKATSLVRIPAPKAGVKCYIDKTNHKTTIVLAGLPTKKPESGTWGTLYVENGFLKVWNGN